jgi:hypothetical protein
VAERVLVYRLDGRKFPVAKLALVPLLLVHLLVVVLERAMRVVELVAQLTLEALVADVDALVQPQLGRTHKYLVALWTRDPTQTLEVLEQVHLENVLAGKAFGAFGALELSFAVDLFVIGQLEFRLEVLSAHVTLLGLLVRVGIGVGQQVFAHRKGTTANFTNELFGPVMGFLVGPVVAAIVELDVAVLASAGKVRKVNA